MLKVQVFEFNPFQENTYLLYNSERRCMIVDAGCYNRSEQLELVNFIAGNGLTPELLINTHCHIDHIFGIDFVARHFGLVPMMPSGEKATYEAGPRVAEMYGLNYTHYQDVEYFDSETIALGSDIFEVLFVPGHAPGHVAFYHKGEGLLLAGDVLFRESIGRADLPGGDMYTLLNSIRTKLFTLPDSTVVYPGHMGSTTIGHEKKYNPFLN